jgi:4-amino-4-deoxy-L-arabinose transferase-like glycosyltransferase
LRLETAFLAFVIVIAIFVRFYRLGEIPSSLYWDEVSAVYTPYLYQIGEITLPVRGAMVYFLTGNFFTYELFGASSFFTRLPGVVFGVGLVFVVYLLAKEMFSRRVGLISALLVAISPWPIHFSRTQSFNTAYVFFFVLGLLLLYRGMKESSSRKKKIAWISLSALTLGLSANIVSSGHIFVPLFVAAFALVWFARKPARISINFPRLLYGILFAAILSALFVPVIMQFQSMDDNVKRALAFSTFANAKSIPHLVELFLNRAIMHLSPGFLVYTLPSSHDLGFQETLSRSAQILYSPTIFGQLNYVSILVYPGIPLLLYRSIRGDREFLTILIWIICYAIVSGIAYYDNPNPARNIVGMPALIITISLVIDLLMRLARDKRASSRSVSSRPRLTYRTVTAVGLALLVFIPAGLFFNEYYSNKYEKESAKVYDYGYKQVAQFLSDNNLWNDRIYLHDNWDRYISLSFYSGKQLPPKITTISDLNILKSESSGALKSDKQFVSIHKPMLFREGVITYEVRLEKMYPGPSSSHLFLTNEQGGRLSMAIYSDKSDYSPGTYLLSQKYVSADYSQHTQENRLSGISDYQDWTRVRLEISPDTVLVYLNNRFVSSWPRPADDTYTSINLAAESASANFRNLIASAAGGTTYNILQDNGNISSNNNSNDVPTIERSSPDRSDGQNSNGGWEISNGELIRDAKGMLGTITLTPLATSESLLITKTQEDAPTLASMGIDYVPIKEIRYPDGTVAFTIFKLSSPQPQSSNSNIHNNSSSAAATAVVTADNNTNGGDNDLTRPSESSAKISPSTSAQASSYILTVKSIKMDGSDLEGMWTVVGRQDGSVAWAGFTPLTITLPAGKYEIGVGNYQRYVFDHWADSNSNVEPRDIDLDRPITLVAVYQQ